MGWLFRLELLGSANDSLRHRPSPSIPRSERFNGDAEGGGALRLGQAELRPNLPQGLGFLGHRSRRCHWCAVAWKRMDGDEIGRSQTAECWREFAKSISVGRFRPVEVSGGTSARIDGPVRGCANSLGNGAPGRIRTFDPRLRRPVLYPTELRARIFITNDLQEFLALQPERLH